MLEVRDIYQSLVESSDDAIVAKDLDSVVIAWNPASERLFGWTADEMIGQSMRRLLPPGYEIEEDRILEQIRAGIRVGQFFTKRVHKNGNVMDMSITVSPVRNSDGVIVGASSIARDAGPYLRDQARLKDSEERFRMLAESMSQFAWIARADGHIFWYNKRWYDYTGTTLEQMDGWGWKAVHHPDHVDRVTEVWRNALEEGEGWEDTFPLKSAGGEWRWFLSRAMPIRDDEGSIQFWFGTNTDITEQREQAEQIRLLLMEVNHRSKNMLSTIQALARRSSPDEDGFLTRFENRVRSLAVNQDILVRRQWKEVPADELVHHQLAFIDEVPGELNFSGPVMMLAPRTAEVVGMALHELATNSIKYGALSVPGGKVDISWSPREDGTGLRFGWIESGGPQVVPPKHSGFGTTLIREVPLHNLEADVTLDYESAGLRWEMTAGPEVLAEHARIAA